jgi:serine/threonine protein phosphatase PrpC
MDWANKLCSKGCWNADAGDVDPQAPQARSSPFAVAAATAAAAFSSRGPRQSRSTEAARLREAFLADGGERDEDTSTASLDQVWGVQGSWQIIGDAPVRKDDKEPFYNVRKLRCYPKTRAKDIRRMLDVAGVGIKNIKGNKGKKLHCTRPGQDHVSVSRLSNGWEVFCIADGHGPEGNWPSMRVVRVLPYFLQSGLCDLLLKKGFPAEALAEAFRKTQLNLEQRAALEKTELNDSGCTCAVVLRHPEIASAWVGHVGDSKTILLSTSQGSLRYTQDHLASVPSERRRIESLGGDVRTPRNNVDRVYLKGQDQPGLMVSRAFGDLWVKSCGVHANPDIAEWPIDGFRDSYVLSASDGVWEIIDMEDIVRMVTQAQMEQKSSQAIVERLVGQAMDHWAAKKREEYCDDITVLLFPLIGYLPVLEKRQSMGCFGGCRQRCVVQ